MVLAVEVVQEGFREGLLGVLLRGLRAGLPFVEAFEDGPYDGWKHPYLILGLTEDIHLREL